MNKNITLDFTANRAVESTLSNQELAIMPASLAKKLLQDYADRLERASATSIIRTLGESLEYICHNLNETTKIKLAIEVCADFIQERTIIEACSTENWDLFKVIPEPTSEVKSEVDERNLGTVENIHNL